ncbi:MAG TPA: peptidylprolyl isomerase [Chloroflexota bacterium]|nr:peptidylprolyl isomerase [Chloroflexota bacterium]
MGRAPREAPADRSATDARRAAREARRQSAVSYQARPDGRAFAFGWGDHLTRAEKDRIQSRLAAIGISAALALVILLIGGTLAWDRIYFAQRPVVRVDGQPITLRAYTNLLTFHRNRLELQYLELAQMAGQGGAQNPFAQMAQQQLQQLEQRLNTIGSSLPEEVIEERLIRAEAAKRGLKVTPEEIEERLKLVVGYQDPATVPTPAPTEAPTPPADATAAPPTVTPRPTTVPTRTPRSQGRSESFEGRLRDYRRLVATDEDVIRSQVEYDLVRSKLFEEIGKTAPASSEQVHARHILVADEGVANSIVDRIVSGGESFEAIAAEVSLDTSNAQSGGDLGWFTRGAMVSEFDAAAFSQPIGQVGPPVKTSFGWHVIRVEEREANRALEGSALEQAKNSAIQKWLDAEKQAHRIERLMTQDMIDWAERNTRRPQFGR